VNDGLRSRLRRVLPQTLRDRVAIARREIRDRVSGEQRLIVRPSQIRVDPRGQLEALRVTQTIRQSDHWEGKLHNLRLAARMLDGVKLAPSEIFSFWTLVGRPTQSRGFAIGRAIRADHVGEDVGGGLCQISGLAYEMGLRAGLKIVERHPHSRDLYDETTRFTPLGFDATVVWGHKDLRMRNTLSHWVAFGFEISDSRISGRIFADSPMVSLRVEAEREDASDGSSRFVRVRRYRRSGAAELVSEDVYAVSAQARQRAIGVDQSMAVNPW
jgi:vancomycin resistance protein VanW